MHASASENLPYKKRKENRQSQEVSFAIFINLFKVSFDNISSHFLNLLSWLGSFLPIDYQCNVIKSSPFTSLQDSGDFRSQTSIIASSDDNLSDCTECMINLLLLNLSPCTEDSWGPFPTALHVTLIITDMLNRTLSLADDKSELTTSNNRSCSHLS